MVPERLWAAFREDTLHFHVRLFRCFLLGFLDAHSDLGFLSQGSERIWAVLGRRLADVGLVRDAGRLHEPGPFSHRARCPPKGRYEATWVRSFSAMDQTVPVPPFVSQPVNITRGLHDEPRRSAVAFDIPGSGRVLGGYDALVTVGCILLSLFTLAIVVARARSDSTRTVCRLPTVAVDATTNSCERVFRSLPPRDPPTDEAIQGLLTNTFEVVEHQAFMPGAWLHERREQSTLETLEESVLDAMPWTLFHSCAQMGIKAWAHISGLTCISAASDPLNRDVVTIGRKSEDGRFPVGQGLGLNAFDLDAGVSTTDVLNETEQLGVAPDRLPSECGHCPGNLRESTTAVHNRRCETSVMGGAAIRDLDPAQMTTLDVVCGGKIGLSLALVASSNTDRGDMSLDGDESASEDGSDEGLFGTGSRRANISPLEKKDAYRVLGRQQVGALSDTGCPFSLRRAHSTGHLRKKRDIFDDDDEGTGDDFYWTEQVNARLSDERGFRSAPGWSDGCSWPREGREDESDNWRTRNSQVFAAPEEASDTVQCQVDNSTKLCRYSSPPLNVNVLLSHRSGSEDGPPGIYVVPQKRGRTWSPVSSPRPSGLGFFPFRKTPSLLTPEAWGPGCLYLSDPPVDESREADVWWDSLTRSAASAAAGKEQGPPCSRDVQEGAVSWRDRYENDPASRRIISVHQRATTEG